MGNVVQQERNLQHHNSLKRITFNWWQWGILKLFAQNQMKGHLLFNVWWMSMKRAMPPFEQGIQNCSKMIFTYLRQVRNWWCACPLTSLMGWRIEMDCIDHKWLVMLMKHLKKAQSSNIKQIRFVRHIGRLDIYEKSIAYDIEDDCYIYEIFLENNTTHYVSFGQINDVIGDEEWLQREVNCLCNIALSWIISLSWGAKKKQSTNSDALCICVGDRVSVENHGKHWIRLGHIISIYKNTKQLLWSGKRYWKRTLLT